MNGQTLRSAGEVMFAAANVRSPADAEEFMSAYESTCGSKEIARKNIRFGASYFLSKCRANRVMKMFPECFKP